MFDEAEEKLRSESARRILISFGWVAGGRAVESSKTREPAPTARRAQILFPTRTLTCAAA